jgi:hypothetical protein
MLCAALAIAMESNKRLKKYHISEFKRRINKSNETDFFCESPPVKATSLSHDAATARLLHTQCPPPVRLVILPPHRINSRRQPVPPLKLMRRSLPSP